MSHCVTRRQFVKGLGSTVTLAAVGGYSIGLWSRSAQAGPLILPSPSSGSMPAGSGTLVVLELGGGNDGLNMVIPHANSAYYDLRRNVAIDEPIDLDGEVGLHPELTFVAERFAAGEVAIVEGIGYPDPDLSHFASMATWWSGTPGATGIATGWLGRYLDATTGDEDPLASVIIGPGPTPALLAERAFAVTVQDSSGLSPLVPPWIDDVGELMATWAGFAPGEVKAPGLLSAVREAIGATVAAAGALDGVLTAPVEEAPRSLSTSLAVAAQLITSGVAPRVIYVHGFGDFDTHDGQATRHGDLMGELNGALASFFDAIEGHLVTVITTSEFGRRAADNGAGTDHGTAAAQLVIGNSVNGGRHGVAPDLTRLDRNGNLVHTVDYRSFYASVLDQVLGAYHPDILGADYETLPLIA